MSKEMLIKAINEIEDEKFLSFLAQKVANYQVKKEQAKKIRHLSYNYRKDNFKAEVKKGYKVVFSKSSKDFEKIKQDIKKFKDAHKTN